MSVIKVLLIDDELDLLEISKQLLERDRYISVTTASSAARALELIDLHDYDVVVSDYQMPGKDGIQLLKDIRQTKNKIPFILFTGRGREEVVIEALNNGADFYVQKGGEIRSQFAELANIIKQAHSKKQGELTLLISEERYRSLFQNSVDAVILSTINGDIISANPSACHLFGITEDELKHVNIEEMMVEKGKWNQAIHIGKSTGIVNREFNFKKRDGSTFTGESNLGFFTGPDCNARISIIVRDNTEKKKKVEELKASEERYRRLFETAQDGILILDFEKEIIIDANKFILDLTGYSLEETLDKSLWELGFMKDKALAEEAFNELRTVGYVRYDDIPLRKKNGESLPVEFISNVYTVNNDKIVQCNIRDISERVENKRKLETSELRYRRLFETAQDGILILDLASGKIIDANKFILDLTGYTQNEVTGKSLWELGFMRDKALADEAFSQLRSEGYTRYEDIPLRRKNGAIIPVEFISNSYMVGSAKIVQCNIRDISERELRDAKIKELANIVDSTADAVIGANLQGTITSWNNGAEGIYGYAKGEILGKPVPLLAAPESKDDLENILARVTKGEIVTHFETTNMRKDGGKIDVSLTVSAVRDNQGIIIGFSTIASDITERKYLDTALKEVKKKLNLLSSITRHDINNHLTVLMGNLELMESIDLDTSPNKHLHQAMMAAKRISTTLEFTKTYEDIGVHEPVWHDVRTLVAEAVADVPTGRVKVLNDCPPGIEVFADPLIAKVFFNLIDNAIQHGVRVTTVRVYLEEKDGAYSIVCEDDGAGIEAAAKEKLFTRGFGKNNGLGLFLSREIVSITGASLEETGIPGQGARFVMTIPPYGIRVNRDPIDA